MTSHPKYSHDSRVTESINYDLIQLCRDITDGKVETPDLLPKYETKSAQAIPRAMVKEECYIHHKTTGQDPDLDCVANGVLGMTSKECQ